MVIWELRFLDGRGSSVFTTDNVTRDIGQLGVIKHVRIAAAVSRDSAVRDAERCLETGRTLELVAHMGAIAYAVRHSEGDESDS